MVRLYALSLIILAVTVACAESARLGSLRPSDTVVTAEDDAAALEAVAELESNTAAALTAKASKADLAAEVNRAQAAEAALDARLDAAEPAIVAAQADASAALGAAAEAKTAADAAAVRANAAHTAASNAATKADLSAESARAQAAEADAAAAAASALSAAQAAQTAAASAKTKADAAHTVASAAVTQSQLQAESARAQAAEADARNQAIKSAEAAAEAIGAASDASAAASAAVADIAAAVEAADAAVAAASDVINVYSEIEERAYPRLVGESTPLFAQIDTRDTFGPASVVGYLSRIRSFSINPFSVTGNDALQRPFTAVTSVALTGVTLVYGDGVSAKDCSWMVYGRTDGSAEEVLVKTVAVDEPVNQQIIDFDPPLAGYTAVRFRIQPTDWAGSDDSQTLVDSVYILADQRSWTAYGGSACTPSSLGNVSGTPRLTVTGHVSTDDPGWFVHFEGADRDRLVTRDDLDDALADLDVGIVAETDPTVPAWAKAPEKPAYTAAEVGAAPAGDYLTAEADPTVPAWAKATEKPAYTAAEVGAQPAGDYIGEDGGTVHGILRLENPRIAADADAGHDIAIVPNAEGEGLQIQFPDGTTAYFAKRTGTVAMVSDIPKDISGPVWVHPGDWTLAVRPLDDTVVEDSATNVSTNVLGQIVGTRSLTVTQGNTVSVSPQPLDQLPTGTAPEALTYTLISGPATLSTDGNAATLTATGDGLARVSATDGTVTRTVMTSFRQDVTDYDDVITYLGDADGTVRAGVNDAFLAVLQARDTSVTVPSGVTPAVAACDYLYATNGTAPTAFSPTLPLDPSLCCMVDTKVSQYGQRHFAIAPHFALTAAHWWPGGVGRTGRWLTPDGTVATTTTTGGVRLRDWAIANGYTTEEASAVSDIYVFRTDNAIPDACIPYVIDRPAIDAIFGGSLRGINCYAVAQNGYLTYSYYLSDVGSSWAAPGLLTPSSLGLSNLPCRRDIALLLAPSYAAQIYGGDSGMPVFFVYEGKPVVTSLFWTVMAGSSLVTGADILDAYIRQASGGAESLKRITIPSEVNE